MTEIKKALMIAYIFPPLGGSGVQRSLKFVKYLPEFGWKPYVVCSDASNIFNFPVDQSLMEEISSEVVVYRFPFISPLGLRRRIQSLLGAKSQRDLSINGPKDQVASITNIVGERSTLQRLMQLVSKPLSPIEFPAVDAALYWALAIVPGCLRLLRREKIDLIYSTSFPYSDHVTGYCLKKLTGKPWVADFRDPWTQNAAGRNSGWRYRVDQWVERRILNAADRVIGVTPTYTADLRRLAPKRPGADFVTIENGYDGADFAPEAVKDTEAALPITLAHVGRVYDGTALPFLQALEALGEAGSRLKVRFIGGLEPQERRWLEGHALAAQVQIEPRLPHAAAVRAMQHADVLLLFVIGGSPRTGHYPGKLFEYMASGRPILLVGPDGDAAKLIQHSGTGCFICADDLSTIVATFMQMIKNFEEFKRKIYQPRQEVIASFERRALTGKLVNTFNEILR